MIVQSGKDSDHIQGRPSSAMVHVRVPYHKLITLLLPALQYMVASRRNQANEQVVSTGIECYGWTRTDRPELEEYSHAEPG